MEIRVIDFDRLTRSYSNYRDGIKSIEGEKNEFLSKLGPLKKEMEDIINSAKSGLLLDPSSQRQKEVRFAELQQEAMQIDGDFKANMRELHDSLNKKTFDELSDIINEWAKENSIDLVTGKMEVVFATERLDATDIIINILKEREMYFEDSEESTASVSDQITDSVTQSR
jgi:Skp family chaperone for outer membrane proteins